MFLRHSFQGMPTLTGFISVNILSCVSLTSNCFVSSEKQLISLPWAKICGVYVFIVWNYTSAATISSIHRKTETDKKKRRERRTIKFGK